MRIASPIAGVAHLGIRVHDLSRSLAFYEKLGFVRVAGPFEGDPVVILEHPGGVEINLIVNAAEAVAENPLMDVPEKLPGYTHVALLVRSLDAADAFLAEVGIPIKDGPVRFPNGARALFIRDPDLNVIELHESDPSRHQQ